MLANRSSVEASGTTKTPDVPAEGDVARPGIGEHADPRLERLAIAADKAHQRDRCITEMSRERRKIVERYLGRGIENVILPEQIEAGRFRFGVVESRDHRVHHISRLSPDQRDLSGYQTRHTPTMPATRNVLGALDWAMTRDRAVKVMPVLLLAGGCT